MAVVERLFWQLGTHFSGRCRCREVAVLLGVDVNRNDNSPKSLPIDFKNRQATKNTTGSQGKSILLRNRSNFYGFKQSRWFPIQTYINIYI